MGKISGTLAKRTEINAEHMMQQRQKHISEDRVELFGMLSQPVQIDLHYEIYWPVLRLHPFYTTMQYMSTAMMRRVCHIAASRLLLSKGDILFQSGEIPDPGYMYFLLTGQVWY